MWALFIFWEQFQVNACMYMFQLDKIVVTDPMTTRILINLIGMFLDSLEKIYVIVSVSGLIWKQN